MNKRAMVIFLSAIYATVLQISFTYIVFPAFEYRGFISLSTPYVVVLLKVLLATAPACWMRIEISKPSQFQLWILYVLVIVPAIMIGNNAVSQRLQVEYIFYIICILLSFGIMSFIAALPPLKIPTLRLPAFFIWIIILAYSAMSYFLLYKRLGMPESILTFDKVGLARIAFKDIMEEIPLLERYLVTWQGIVVNPLVLSIGLTRKNVLLTVGAIFLQLALYTFTSFRSLALSSVFVTLIWCLMFFVRRYRGLAFLVLILLLTVSSALGAVVLEGLGAIPPYLVLERLLSIPGFLTGAYFDFFSQHPFAYLSGSFLKFTQYPYGSYSLGEVIGDNYLALGPGGRPSNAVANFWADGFANFGYPGIIILSILTSLVLRVIDGAFRDVDSRTAVLVFSTVSLSLAAQGLHRCLLTGGLIPIIFIGIVAGSLFKFPEMKRVQSRKVT